MIRQAVILGTGDRAGDLAALRVAGLPLRERTEKALGRAGLTAILFVEGTAGLLAARDQLEERFLLLTCDQVFDPALARRTAAADAAGAEVVSCRKDGRDCGLYAATRTSLLDALAPGATLAAAMSTLRTTPLDAGTALWARVDSPAAAVAARKALFRSLRKPTDGPVSRWINRAVSLSVTRLALDTNLTPNQMTVMANAIGFLGVWFTFQATWVGLAIGAALVQAQSILDGCDGEIARLKFKSSKLGEWLDNVTDDQVNVLYAVGLAYSTAQLTDRPEWLWLGVAAAAATTAYNLLVYCQLAFVHKSGNPFHFRWWFQKDGADLQETMSRPGLGTLLAGGLRALARRDVFLLAFLVLALLRVPQVAIVWYAVIAVGYFAMTVVHLLAGGMPVAASVAETKARGYQR